MNAALDDTKQRIIQAAIKVFADKGFRRGTIKAMAEAAGVNIAAINYHFGNKKNLYSMVVDQWIALSNDLFARRREACAGLPPEEQLHSIIQTFLRLLLLESEETWIGRLLGWEFTMEPTEILDKLVEMNLGPVKDELGDVICALLGECCNDKLTRLYTMNVLAQCVYLYTYPRLAKRLFDIEVHTLKEVQDLTEYITRFSLDAITMERKRQKQK